MSRPGTASRPSTASRGGDLQISRPSTASGSSGRRHLSSSSIDTGRSSGLFVDNPSHISTEILTRELDQDSLLRIMNHNRIQLENEAFSLVDSSKDDLNKLKNLIEQGLNINQCIGLHGYSLLHHASQRGHNHIITELLRPSYGLSVNITNHIQETPLHLAVYSGQILTVDQLLDYGASINAINEDGETCLFYAARKSYPAIIRLLIQRGIDITIKDHYGDTAIDQATNPLVIKAIESGNTLTSSSSSSKSSPYSNSSERDKLTYDDILRIFHYLEINDILRCACVCSKWHRVSEHSSIWKSRGVRKWELALQNSLGFGMTRASSFLKPPRRSSGGSSNTGGGGGGGLMTSNSVKQIKRAHSTEK